MKTLYVANKKRWYIGIPCAFILLGVVLYFVFGGFAFARGLAPETVMKFDIGKEFDLAEAEGVVKGVVAGATVESAGENELSIKIAYPLAEDEETKLIDAVKAKYQLRSTALVARRTTPENAGMQVVFDGLKAAAAALALLMLYMFIRNEYSAGLAAAFAQIIALLALSACYVIFRIPLGEAFAASLYASIITGFIVTTLVYAGVRENTRGRTKRSFAETVNISIRDVLGRTAAVTFAVLVMLLALSLAFAPEVSLAAIPVLLGVLWGAYAGVFVAAPLWAVFRGGI